MAVLTSQVSVAKKRRIHDDDVSHVQKRQKVAPPDSTEAAQAEILSLETNILKSKKNYNDILTLLNCMKGKHDHDEKALAAAVALCRVFCHLMASGSLKRTRTSPESDLKVIEWLNDRLVDCHENLLGWLKSTNPLLSGSALTLLMRLMGEEAKHADQTGQAIGVEGALFPLIDMLISQSWKTHINEEFIKKFVAEYDDIRYFSFSRTAERLATDVSEEQLDNILSFLAAIPISMKDGQHEPSLMVLQPSKAKRELACYSCSSQLKQAQRAWMALLAQPLTKRQSKYVLDILPARIVPWFLKVELLMDFLTDSFDMGGSTSLTALSGLFHLIQQKNLDYPHFYVKLYSLLNKDVLHSKHRSRFFRLLDTFLASTHLPAALVASFIKRLSRLCLFAPPSGIVAVVPWIYNLLKTHPACTFMIHRITELEGKNEVDWGDPFQVDESDPMETGAIESSLWEIETLQSHYHPNVATIAKIISEQFTKQAYNVEDFLDHSYGTMLNAELSKDLTKAPEIEYEISKKILTKMDPQSGNEDSLLVKLWDFLN
ncbi:uncharacterized protein KY384_004230 [Bacidia gigantensis]|uniref:uncharacterized protein n=1 Tax=Bacidia gigantensis TaxID=2732470 RepID=UPI001D042461|nr:uncharacterized protein KY384_004230 [Bacidia gigantensis]KAG8530873.1 hypothetical protein KY384_004230 [Bacidia gigantensis]